MNDFSSYSDAFTFAERLVMESLAASDREAALKEIDTLKRYASPLLQSAMNEVMARGRIISA